MNGFQREREVPGCGEDLAAYALGALAPEEVRALEQHLASCAVCRDELTVLERTAEALPLAVPQLRAPRVLKRRLMAEVRADARRSQRTARRRLDWRTGWPAAPALAGAIAIAAAITAVVIATAGGSAGGRTVQASVTIGGASAVLSETDGRGTLLVRHMPQPPAGKIYEVWLQRGTSAPAPTDALFGVSSRGAAAVAVPGSLHGVSAVLVTPEPRGGSSVPTHSPVIVARV